MREFQSDTKIGEFVIDLEQAKAYLYAKSTKRRVLSWTDIQVNIFV